MLTTLRRFAAIVSLASLAVVSPSQAETIKIGVSKQSPEWQSVSRPPLGMKMDEVASQFGEPQQRHPAIGEPPISRWDYEKFSVYFEYQTVLHTVLRHNPVNPPKATQ